MTSRAMAVREEDCDVGVDVLASKLSMSKLNVSARKMKNARKLLHGRLPRLVRLPSTRRHRLPPWAPSLFLSPDITSFCTLIEADEHGVGITLCRSCGISFCAKNSPMCYNCHTKQEGFVEGIPNSIVVKYCNGCQSYSFTGRTEFFNAPPRSATLLSFFLRRIDFHLIKLQLHVAYASFLPTSSDTKNIKIALTLGGVSTNCEKHHTIDYHVVHQTCYTCSCMGTDYKWKSVVKLRQLGSGQRGLISLFARLPRRALSYSVKMCMPVSNGVDFFFSDNSDSLGFYYLLCRIALVMPTEPIESGSESCIRAVVCPFSYNDLYYLRSEDMASWGFSGPIAICTGVSSSITFVDPFTQARKTVGAFDYWSAPFEPLRTAKDLVEYLVVDVQIISSEGVHTFADVEVASLSDFGRRDTTLITRSHLGQILKPGDHVFGYDLTGIKRTLDASSVNSDLVPEVVLVRKKPTRGPVRGKKTSPEYEDFLRDLDKNPEAMFNLSLNNENSAQNQQPGLVSSLRPEEKADFDLEDLLADLHLGGVDNDASDQQ